MKNTMANTTSIFSSTFIFAKGQYDLEFYKLDEAIAAVAKSIPGYIGEETWENPSNGLISNVYYWDSMDALHQLVSHPSHREAKEKQSKWLAGYQVVISQVLRTYGDARLAEQLPKLTLRQDALY
jgi:heme-degrading monooxygenase HmoA